MGNEIKYDKKIFEEKIASLVVEHEKLVSYKEEYDAIIEGVTAKECWKGNAAISFEERAKDASKRFKTTIKAIEGLKTTIEKAMMIVDEDDKKMAKELERINREN